MCEIGRLSHLKPVAPWPTLVVLPRQVGPAIIAKKTRTAPWTRRAGHQVFTQARVAGW